MPLITYDFLEPEHPTCPTCGQDWPEGRESRAVITQSDLVDCKKCGDPMIWAREFEGGPWIPLNPEPVDDGAYLLTGRSKHFTVSILPEIGKGFAHHASTCKKKFPKGYLSNGSTHYATIMQVNIMPGLVEFLFQINNEGVITDLVTRVPIAFGEGSDLYRWVETIIQRKLEKGETFELDNLVGRGCMVSVNHQRIQDVVGGDLLKKLESLANLR